MPSSGTLPEALIPRLARKLFFASIANGASINFPILSTPICLALVFLLKLFKLNSPF